MFFRAIAEMLPFLYGWVNLLANMSNVFGNPLENFVQGFRGIWQRSDKFLKAVLRYPQPFDKVSRGYWELRYTAQTPSVRGLPIPSYPSPEDKLTI
jgi:hypothetical protein